MSSYDYDLIVIGSGPAGEKGAAQAAYFHKRVALVERESVPGGAAANTGTLPSKTLRETALFLSGFRNRDLKGLDIRLKDTVSIQDFMGRERLIVDTERRRILNNLQKHQVPVLQGTARFVDEHTLAIAPSNPSTPEQTVTAGFVLIATGSRPFRPPAFRIADPRVCDSDTILSIGSVPKRLIVVGGGVIGCEYACIFAILGVTVMIVEQRDRPIGFMDREVSQTLRREMEEIGVEFHMNDGVETLEVAEDPSGPVRARLKSGPTLEADLVLVSSGRTGNTGALGLDRVGITANERGLIAVNAHYQTSLPHVYAAGDVIGNPALASTSMEQARVAMVHAFQLKYKSDVAQTLPSGIYTIPECSSVGLTEDQAQDEGIAHVVGRAAYTTNARGVIVGDHDGFLKLVFAAEDMRLLGAHMIGEYATELIHIGLTAILSRAGADLFIKSCYNYPTLSELYKYATYDALGRRAAMTAP